MSLTQVNPKKENIRRYFGILSVQCVFVLGSVVKPVERQLFAGAEIFGLASAPGRQIHIKC
jgi:hypothetical protein